MTSPETQLTPNQAKCLDLQRNLSVEAGAGSGKTRVLVERYVEILRTTDLQVDNLVAITFTRKAAAEMLERIGVHIRKRLKTDPGFCKNAARWDRVLEDLARAHICTIHAFCERLLRLYPIEAGVDPAFQVLESFDLDILIRESVEEVMFEVSRLPEDDPDHGALGDLLTDYDRFSLGRMLEELLHQRRAASRWALRFADLTDEQILLQLEEAHFAAQKEAVEQWLADEDLLNGLAEVIQVQPHNTEDNGYRKVQSVAADIKGLANADGLPAAAVRLAAILDAFTTSKGGPYKKFPGAKKNWPPAAVEEFMDLCHWLSRRVSRFTGRIFGEMTAVDRVSAPILRRLLVLYRRVEDRLDEKKGRGGLLDFDDMEECVQRLLCESDAASAVLGALRTRFRHFMIDEFQDTNAMQWNIIKPLVSDEEGRLQPDRVFIVGDPKQSIYSFRGADVQVMSAVSDQITEANRRNHTDKQGFTFRGAELPAALEERFGRLNLVGNFRSLRGILDFVNGMFARLMDSEEGGFEIPYVPMHGKREGPEAQRGRVELLAAVGPESGDEEHDEAPSGAELEAKLVAAKIAEVVSPESEHKVYAARNFEGNTVEDYVQAEPGHVAVLLRSRLRLAELERALRQRGIPYSVYRGIGFFQRQEIYDILNLLAFLTNERDDIALAGVLRSPLFGISDEGLYWVTRAAGEGRGKRGCLFDSLISLLPSHFSHLSSDDRRVLESARGCLARWRDMADRLPAADLLRCVLDDTGLLGSLMGTETGRQAAANVEKLLDWVRAAESRAPTPLHELVARIEALSDLEAAEGQAQLEMDQDNCVKIMTVHAAKGLEFPIVFVPDMASDFILTDKASALADEDLGIGLSVPDPEQKGERKATSLRRAIQERQKRSSLAEQKRLLYVAVTRARDEVYLSGATHAAWLESRRSLESAGESWWKWLFQSLAIGPEEFEAGEVVVSAQDDAVVRVPITLAHDKADVEPRAPSRPRVILAERMEAADASAGSEFAAQVLRDIEFVEEGRRFPAFSPTAIMAYEFCPAAYFYKYQVGLPEPPLERAAAAAQGRSRAQAVGRVAHGLLENLAEALNAEEERLRLRAGLLARSEADLTESERELVAAEAVSIVSECRRSGFLRGLLDVDESYPELAFTLKLKSGVINGRIDLLCRRHGGPWRIIDYKTSRLGSPDGQTEKVGRLRARYERQMQIYALAVQRILAGPPAEIEAILFLTDLGEGVAYQYNEKLLRGIETALEAELEAIVRLQPENIELRRTAACRTCGFAQTVCPRRPLPAPLRRSITLG